MPLSTIFQLYCGGQKTREHNANTTEHNTVTINHNEKRTGEKQKGTSEDSYEVKTLYYVSVV
jgi:hypothetical protein